MATSFRFDHAVIVVNNVYAAIADYQALGFTVVYGGQHKGGATHNALVVFADGGYLELLAPIDPKLTEHLTALKNQGKLDEPDANLGLSPRFARALGAGEGLGLFALLTPNLAENVQTMREGGLEINDPQPGGRFREDGQEIRWQTAMPNADYLPFLIQDETPRPLRVPDDPGRTRHENSVTGIAGIEVLVHHLEECIASYRVLLDMEPQSQPAAHTAVFALDNLTITLVEPTDDETRERMYQRGPRPDILRLRAENPAKVPLMDLTRTHYTRIEVIS